MVKRKRSIRTPKQTVESFHPIFRFWRNGWRWERERCGSKNLPCVYCSIDSVTLHIKKFSLFYCCENQIRMFAKGKIGAHKIDWVREYDTSVCVYVSKCFSMFVIFKLRFNIFFSSFYFESNSFLMYTISLSCFPKNTWKPELFGLLGRGKSSWFSKKIHRFIFKAE